VGRIHSLCYRTEAEACVAGENVDKVGSGLRVPPFRIKKQHRRLDWDACFFLLLQAVKTGGACLEL